MKKTIAFISSGKPHPTTLECAKTIGADIYEIKRTRNDSIFKSFMNSIKLFFIMKKYNYYLVESALSIFPVLMRRYFLFEKNCIIHRANSVEYNILLKNQKVSLFNYFLSKFMLSKVDYCIAISKLVKSQVKEVFPKRIVYISHTFLYEETFFDKENSKENFNFVFVGDYLSEYDTKGIKLLIQYFNNLYAKELINSKLYIVGRNTKNLSYLNKYPEKIKLIGYASPEKYFQKAVFYIHNAKFEAGGTVVLEAMANGLIPIISKFTGNSDFLKFSLLKYNIYDPYDYDSFESIVKKNYCMDLNSIKKFSFISRQIVLRKGTKKTGTENFINTINKIIKKNE